MSQAAAFALGAVNTGAEYVRTAKAYYSPWDQYIYINPASSNFSEILLGTNDFCIEVFLNFSALGSNTCVFSYGNWSSFQAGALKPDFLFNVLSSFAGGSGVSSQPSGAFNYSTSPYPYYNIGFTAPEGMANTMDFLQQWHHCAVIRKGNTIQTYIDGTPGQSYKMYWNNAETPAASPPVIHFNQYGSPVYTDGRLVPGYTYVVSTLSNTNWYEILGTAGTNGARFTAVSGGFGLGNEQVVATDGSFTVGQAYVIQSLGNSNWSDVGAGGSPYVGQEFVATKTATTTSGGTGTAIATTLSKSSSVGWLTSSHAYMVTDNAVVASTNLIVGQTYWITSVGTSTWTAVGATSPYSVGQQFVATAATTGDSGTGTAVGVDWTTVGATGSVGSPPANGYLFTATGAGTIPANPVGAALPTVSTSTTNDGSFVPGTLYYIYSLGTTNWATVGANYDTPAVGNIFVATAASGSGNGTAVALSKVSGSGVTNDGSFVIGRSYMIKVAGNTNWTAIGASDNNVGTSFIASGVGGAGTGTAVQTVTTAYGMVQHDLGAGSPINVTSSKGVYCFGGPGGSGGSFEPWTSPYNAELYWRNYRVTIGDSVYTTNSAGGSFSPPNWWEDLTALSGTVLLMVPGASVTAPSNGGTYTNEASPPLPLTVTSASDSASVTTIQTLSWNAQGLSPVYPGAGTNTSASYTATNATTQTSTASVSGPVIGSSFGNFTSGSPTLIKNTSSTALDVGTLSFFIEGWVWIPTSPSMAPKIIIATETAGGVGVMLGDSATSPTTIDRLSVYTSGGSVISYADNIWTRNKWNYFAVQREVSNGAQYFWFWTGFAGQGAAKLLPTIGTQNTTPTNFTNAGSNGVSVGGLSTNSAASDLGLNLVNVVSNAIVPSINLFGQAEITLVGATIGSSDGGSNYQVSFTSATGGTLVAGMTIFGPGVYPGTKIDVQIDATSWFVTIPQDVGPITMYASNSTGTMGAVDRGLNIPYAVPAVSAATTLVLGFQGTNGGTIFNNQTS